ncbi:MAG: hypothetical protein EBZ77_02220 [Chitinophagia bacterium]|nr:hypothetical protein [Chitinophagia bacterium]
MNSKVNVSHVNNMHNQWLRTINFYKTEFAILKGILTEIAGKNTNSDLMKEVEHFENQFRVQNNNMDELSHKIMANVQAIAQQAQHSSAGYIDGGLLADHTAYGEEADRLGDTCNSLVKEFRKFAERVM